MVCRSVPRAAALHRLADGGDHHIRVHGEFRTRYLDRTAPAALVEFAQLHLGQAQALDPPLLARDLQGCDQVIEGDSLVLHFLDLFRHGRHFLPGPAVIHRYGRRPQAQSAAGRIGRHVAAADDGHLLALEVHRLAQVQLAQEGNAGDHAVCVFAGDVQALIDVGAHGDEDGVVVPAQIRQADISCRS